MFIEFFSRAVAAGLITEDQKQQLMEFAKTQPVTSFVAQRSERLPEQNQQVNPVPVVRATHREPWLACLFLALLCLAIGAWVAGFDGGPLGTYLRDTIADAALPAASIGVE